MSTQNAGVWLKQTRKRLRLNQSDIAAYLTFRLRRTVNQARIAEFEKGIFPVPSSLLPVLTEFFRDVENLKRNRHHWTGIFPH